MPRTVTLSDALRLDIVARDQLGSEQGGGLERLLAANPGLAFGGPYAAEGQRITVPDTDTGQTVATSINPWD